MNAERGYLRLDYQASSRDLLHAHAMIGRSSFQLANLRSQHTAGQDQRQLLRDASFWMGWVRTLSPREILETTAAYRTNITQLFSSPGDTPVTADQARHLSTLTLNTRYTRTSGAHTLRGGVDWQHIPISHSATTKSLKFWFSSVRGEFAGSRRGACPAPRSTRDSTSVREVVCLLPHGRF